MDTDLVNAAVGIKQAQLASQIDIAVAKKMIDTERTNGAGMLQLLDAATQTSVHAGDAMVAAATGLGGAVDTYA